MKSKRAKWVLGMALLSIPLAPICYLAVYDWQTAKRKEVALARLKALGYPTTLEEYRQTAPPAEQNAAPLLEELAKEWKELRGTETIDYTTRASPEAIALVRRSEPLLKKARELRNYRTIWVDRDYSQGWDQSFDFAEIKSIVRLHVLSIQLDMDKGDTDGALDKFRTLYHLQELLTREGSTLGMLVGIAISSLINRSLAEQAINTSSLEVRQQFGALIASHPLQVDPKTIVASEVMAADQRWPDDLFDNELAGVVTSDVDRRLAKIENFQRRARTATLEEIADLAELAKDGRFDRFDANTLKLASTRRVDREIFAHALIRLMGGVAYEALAVDVLAGKFAQDLALVDLYIEQAGGPKAVAKPGAQIIRKPGRTEIHGIPERAIYVITGNKFTSERRP